MLTWPMVLYAILSLTVVRMVPVAVALAPRCPTCPNAGLSAATHPLKGDPPGKGPR